MAKRHQRSNREKRKPKSDKKKVAVEVASPFSSMLTRHKAAQVWSNKKGR